VNPIKLTENNLPRDGDEMSWAELAKARIYVDLIRCNSQVVLAIGCCMDELFSKPPGGAVECAAKPKYGHPI
jgi:hypothetical protein